MITKECFIQEIEEALRCDPEFLSAPAKEYFESLKAESNVTTIEFTENGAKILIWMQQNATSFNNVFKAKDIGEGLFISPKSVSGSMRKLLKDGFVSKIGTNPVCYSLTDYGSGYEVPVVDKE